MQGWTTLASDGKNNKSRTVRSLLLTVVHRLISASVGTVVYYGFSCHSQAAAVYLSLCVVTGILGSIFPFMRWFNEHRFKVRTVHLNLECDH